MVKSRRVNLSQKRPRPAARISFCLCAALTCLGMFACPSAFGQTDYSDVWVDQSNPDAPQIVGFGATENDYTSDAIGVETTLTSPSGRTATGYADGSGSASVQVALPWDWNDLGVYTVLTRHQPLCWGNWDGSMIYETHIGGIAIWHFNPDYNRCMEARQTSTTVRFGASQVVFQNTGTRDSEGRCVYRVIPNCNVACTVRGQVEDPVCANYAIWSEPWINTSYGHICLGLFGFDFDRDVLGRAHVIYSDSPQPCTSS
jgi:hypothetical protein